VGFGLNELFRSLPDGELFFTDEPKFCPEPAE